MAFMFEKLEVYRKAVHLADRACALTEGFPRGYGFLADQLNRAALSIATNLTEGNGGQATSVGKPAHHGLKKAALSPLNKALQADLC